MRSSLFALALLVLYGGPVAAESFLDWSRLPDPAAQRFADPFAELTVPQMETLIAVIRLRDRLASGEAGDAARRRIASRLEDQEATLSRDGLDADALLAQQGTVSDLRRRAAEAGNPALDGTRVTIAGFVIAIPGQPLAYLVPQFGMCSHVPPPPPNKLLRLRLAPGQSATGFTDAVAATGTLRLERSRETVMVVDGLAVMDSAWTMEGVKIEALEPLPID